MRIKLVGTLVVAAVLYLPAVMKAGPPPPCIRAAVSADGEILVANEFTSYPLHGTMVRKIKESTYVVSRRYRARNVDQLLNGPDKYWTDHLWQVRFTGNGRNAPFFACSYILVTNDAKHLVLIDFSHFSTALAIFHWSPCTDQCQLSGNDRGELVRSIQVGELAPEIQVPSIVTDEMPAWFAGVAFSFSSDERTLLLKTTQGKQIKISLATGAISR